MLPMMNNMMSNLVSNGADAHRVTQPDYTSLTERLAPFLLQLSQHLASTPHQLVASRKLIQPIVSLPATVESKLRHRNLKRLAHLRNQAFSSIRLNDELTELLNQSEVFRESSLPMLITHPKRRRDLGEGDQFTHSQSSHHRSFVPVI